MPELHVNGFPASNFIALICRRNSAVSCANDSFLFMQQMYKVFINDKPLILSASPDFNFPFGIPELKVQIGDRKSIKQAFAELAERNFNFSGALFYNDDNADKLLGDFISIFPLLEAAGGIVMNNEKERLFIYRFGKWDLPKGKIENGESIKEAALREVQEETGISRPTIITGLPSTFHM